MNSISSILDSKSNLAVDEISPPSGSINLKTIATIESVLVEQSNMGQDDDPDPDTEPEQKQEQEQETKPELVPEYAESEEKATVSISNTSVDQIEDDAIWDVKLDEMRI